MRPSGFPWGLGTPGFLLNGSLLSPYKACCMGVMGGLEEEGAGTAEGHSLRASPSSQCPEAFMGINDVGLWDSLPGGLPALPVCHLLHGREPLCTSVSPVQAASSGHSVNMDHSQMSYQGGSSVFKATRSWWEGGIALQK